MTRRPDTCKKPQCAATITLPDRAGLTVRCQYPKDYAHFEHYACLADKDGRCVPGHWSAETVTASA